MLIAPHGAFSDARGGRGAGSGLKAGCSPRSGVDAVVSLSAMAERRRLRMWEDVCRGGCGRCCAPEMNGSFEGSGCCGGGVGDGEVGVRARGRLKLTFIVESCDSDVTVIEDE